jgi:hypothetical protein
VGSGPGDLHGHRLRRAQRAERHRSERLVLHDAGTTQPSSYTPTAADTKFLGTGPVGTTLTPTAPIVVQQGTWFGVIGACHDAAGTTMHNSYDAGSTASQTTTVLGNPMPVRRLTANMNFVTNATVGTIAMSFATSQIARVDVHVPGNLQSTIPLLAASGDTPYFGGNPSARHDRAASRRRSRHPRRIARHDLRWRPVALRSHLPGSEHASCWPSRRQGTGSVQLPIPNDPSFAALHIYWQGIVSST